ncbi:hypothetical protein [Bradyrhizobium iriomotense]|uniref:hypothetical protein n=1 Tax=Bradyrhizobium iriomotense TaxID=441950 RepID=UPI001B8A3248|nr:hypothetical protein [Bradyrhizobium iriomotense]MBR1133280.1 hypothetical protein [Bradyrhizobium iriomotense]
MKKFVISLASAVVICAFAWCLFVRELAPPSTQARWVEGLYARKEAAARLASNKPKVLIIGGSGVHYGYSAEEITKLTGNTTLNFGIHAGLGASYILHRAKDSLRPGDTAVLALEPHLYVPTVPSDVLSEYVLHYDWSYLLQVDFITAVRIIFGFGPTNVLRIAYLASVPWNSPLARPETVSATGDETVKVSALSTEATRAVLSKAPPMQPNAPPEIPPYLGDFLKWAHENSIRVVQAWTPMLGKPTYTSDRYKAYYATIANWYRDNGAAALDDPSIFFLSIDDMFDYWLHANERGRDKASTILSERLLKTG